MSTPSNDVELIIPVTWTGTWSPTGSTAMTSFLLNFTVSSE